MTIEPVRSPAESPPTFRRRMQRMLASLLLVVVSLWIVACIGLYATQDALVFPRHMTANLKSDRMSGFPATESMTRPIGDGDVEAWFIPAKEVPVEGAPLVVYFHGNAELIDNQASIVANYHERGYAVLLPEYRGYGESAGLPTEVDIIDDAVWFIEQVLQRDDVNAESLVFHGRSLGGAVALGVSERVTPHAIITECTLLNVTSKAWRHGVPSLLVKHPFRSDRRIVRFAGPVLLFHGELDDALPIADSAALASLHEDAQPDHETRFIALPDVGHNDAPGKHYEMQWREIDAFLQRHIGGQRDQVLGDR